MSSLLQKIQKGIEKFLLLLSGRKTTVATVLGAFITYSLGRNYIEKDTADLLSIIMIALGLTANVTTNRLYKKTYGKKVDSESN